MKKITSLLCASILLLAACESTKKEDIIQQKWQAIDLDNPELQMVIDRQKAFLDTIGNSTSEEENLMIYGFKNIDSLKESLLVQLNNHVIEQEEAIKNTFFDFKEDGKVLMTFSETADSANWYFDEEGKLILDEMKLKGAGGKVKMKALTIKSDTLRLKFEQEGMRGIVTFRPVAQ